MVLRAIVVLLLTAHAAGAAIWALHGTERYLTPWLRTLTIAMALIGLFGLALLLRHLGPSESPLSMLNSRIG
jgi:hypothetical protein